MCGIFGYLGPQNASPILMGGLERLAYRGYDSSGIVIVDNDNNLNVLKASGKLENLQNLSATSPVVGQCGIGHTRWATHGEPTDKNAHPHLSQKKNIAVVHNGIVENFNELKKFLIAAGSHFNSDTDTEVIPLLIEANLEQSFSFEEAVRTTVNQLRGAHAIACISQSEPGKIVVARKGNAGGITIGHGNGESFVSSDTSALVPLTTNVTYIESSEMAVITSTECSISSLDGRAIETKTHQLDIDSSAIAKGGFKHFMLKEIMEQPEAATSVLRGRLSFSPAKIVLPSLAFATKDIQSFSRAIFLGMGTSVYAAQVGARYLESFAQIPASVENAAEFRYRDAVLNEQSLVIAISQSGETADTLEALNEAKSKGARTIAITNVEASAISRIADATILMHAGPEIGVASTKTMINSMVVMYLLASCFAQERKEISIDESEAHVQELSQLPALLGDAIENALCTVKSVAKKYAQSKRFLFIGRGLLEPIAREGAMKLKEISYIHAEGMSAAEIKHGPIALVDEETPVIAIALDNPLYEKMIVNMSQVHARKGSVIAIATTLNSSILNEADDVLWVPQCPESLQPIIATIPVQMLAYEIADYLGNDIDQPRNLAKSVTVE